MKILFETERTFIRLIDPTDAIGMFSMERNPNVHTFIGNNPLTSVEQSKEIIDILRKQYNDFGIARWAMLDKYTKEFIGWIGFKYMAETVNKHQGYHDFGYRLKEEFWGKGYATEGSKACLQYGIDKLKLENIFAMTHIGHLASRRVLEKSGFTLLEIFAYDAEASWREAGEPTTWYKYAQKTNGQKSAYK